MEAIEKAVRLKAELDALRPLDKEQEARVMQKFRLDWNYHSNHLEGNSLTYGETKALILFDRAVGDKPLRDYLETKGHNEAVNLVIETANEGRPLIENFIREVNQLVLKEPYKVDAETSEGKPTKKTIYPGQYKTTPNKVVTSTGQESFFTRPEETNSEMSDLLEWVMKNKSKLDPILLAAEFHYKFIKIHPFDDGNGRTARLIMNFILMQNGYPPVIIRTEDKANYIASLEIAVADNVQPFVGYIATSLCDSLNLMIRAANGLSIEDPSDIDKQIALLDQRLKGLAQIGEIYKTKEVLIQFCQASLVKLGVAFVNSCTKFISFYNEVTILFGIDGMWSITISDNYLSTEKYWMKMFEDHKKNISSSTNSFAFHCMYKEFKRIGFQPFDNTSTVSVSLNPTCYIIQVSSLIIEKTYNDLLTDDEIAEIITVQSKAHLTLIEQKIQERESQSN